MVARALSLIVMVYTGLWLTANPVAAQVLDAAALAELEALRSGDMRKLALHAEPSAVPQEPYTGPDGAQTTLGASDGVLRVVNFWATWCAPCREEMPALEALQRQFGPAGLEVVLIATGRNSPGAIEEFFEETGLGLETALDPRSKLAQAMGVPGLPVTVIVNREGAEIARLLGGADWAGPSAQAIVGALLAR